MTRLNKRKPITDGILIIDFEASGLHSESYPTEIAWMDPVRDEKATSFLIRPSVKWLNTHWDPEAEAMTSISKTMIVKEGHPIQEVAKNAMEAMTNASVILTDAPEWDRNWMQGLIDAAWQEFQIPPFMEFQEFLWREFDSGVPLKGKRKHRAGLDVEQMAVAIKTAISRFG